MTFQKISIHNRNLDARLAKFEGWIVPEKTKEEVIAFLRDLSLGKVNQGKKISEVRQLKYLDILRPIFLYFNKPLEELTVKEVEDFDLDLSKNSIKRVDGKPYGDETKSDMKRILKIYLKWKLKDNPSKFAELTSWLDTRIKKNKTPEFLSEDEVEKLYRSCSNARERFLVAVLFDSGARAEEFCNIRYEDVQIPKEGNNYVKLMLKEEYSKTKGRVIGLFWKYSTEAVLDYLYERIDQGIKPNDPIYSGTYDAARQFLSRLGKKVLNRKLHPHLFRHSSATYYASKLNRQQLCIRYGWAFSSRMPDVYISRAGILEKEIEEKFTKTEMGELKRKIEEQEIKNRILSEKLKNKEESDKEIAEKLNLFIEILKNSPKEAESIVRNHKEKLQKIFSDSTFPVRNI